MLQVFVTFSLGEGWHPRFDVTLGAGVMKAMSLALAPGQVKEVGKLKIRQPVSTSPKQPQPPRAPKIGQVPAGLRTREP